MNETKTSYSFDQARDEALVMEGGIGDSEGRESSLRTVDRYIKEIQRMRRENYTDDKIEALLQAETYGPIIFAEFKKRPNLYEELKKEATDPFWYKLVEKNLDYLKSALPESTPLITEKMGVIAAIETQIGKEKAAEIDRYMQRMAKEHGVRGDLVPPEMVVMGFVYNQFKDELSPELYGWLTQLSVINFKLGRLRISE